MARTDAALQLRADPNSLAPERLLVFEVTGSVQNFAKAVARIDGLQFAGEEQLEADDLDKNPEFYLLLPQLGALREIVSLWDQWQQTGAVPKNFAPWRHLFLQLRNVRPWGPADRVAPGNREYFKNATQGAPDTELFRVEIELVFRPEDGASAAAARTLESQIRQTGGAVISRSRRAEFAYHALLADLPTVEVRRIADLDPTSLAGADPVAAIVPQSVGTPVDVADPVDVDQQPPVPVRGDPIVGVFDAVPVQGHPLLARGLVLDDPDDLEARSVGARVHGTAMASLVLHGDLNDPPSPISRRVYFRPVMYAPPIGDELFDRDKLVIDVIVEAVIRMRANGGHRVFVVNLSLGDRTKPFSGKISTWARALDFLSFNYGILFLVSAGNCADGIAIEGFANGPAFARAPLSQREVAIFRALDALKADRRILAPADSVNALTIGSWHRDSCQAGFGGASPFPPYGVRDMPNVSSRLGPGLRRGTKPEALFAGGRHPVRLAPGTALPVIHSHPHPSRFWGLKVAAPPDGAGAAARTHFTMGTSAATALATHSAHRVFDALENAYPQLVGRMPESERAVLLKALLVHSASWRDAETFIRPIVDPDGSLHHEHWRREVCRHLGYGFVDPEDAVACASDRATLWGTGRLGPSDSLTFDVPLPSELGVNTDLREMRATLAWFTPIRPGHLAYRAIKLKIAALQADELDLVGISTTTSQPSNTQSESGTIVHRRWAGERIGASRGVVSLQVQRERDQGAPIDDSVPFGLAVTIAMPGATRIYDEVRAQTVIQPRTRVRA